MALMWIDVKRQGTSLLYIACQNGLDRTVEFLLNNGADVNLCTKTGVGPLYIACRLIHEGTAKLWLHNGADADIK